MSVILSSIDIFIICDVDYCCIVNGNSKSEAINLFKNADLSEKKCSSCNMILLLCIKN